MPKPKSLYIATFILFIIPYVLAYSANSSDYKLWRAQEGYLIYNATDEYKLDSVFYKQSISLNLNSTDYKTCEGFYCFIERVTAIITPSGGRPSVEEAKQIVCKEGELLIYLNNTYQCKTAEEIRKIIVERDWRNFQIILTLILAIIYLESRRRRKKLERFCTRNPTTF